jgi:hypothetical protein
MKNVPEFEVFPDIRSSGLMEMFCFNQPWIKKTLRAEENP